MIVVSAIQFRPSLARDHADVSENIRRCSKLVETAGALRSSLIVLPELFATGYSFLSRDEAFAVSEPQDGLTFRVMSQLAARTEAFLAWGYVERAPEGNLYNSCSLVSPDGDLIASHRKINLWGNDYIWATPGTESAPVVQTSIGAMSVVICRDLRDKIPQNIPRTASVLRNQPVDIVAGCVNWGSGGFPATTWMDFAADNRCVLVVANRWGEEINQSFSQDFGIGGSIIIEPDWTVHTDGIRFNEDCVVSACLSGRPL